MEWCVRIPLRGRPIYLLRDFLPAKAFQVPHTDIADETATSAVSAEAHLAPTTTIPLQRYK